MANFEVKVVKIDSKENHPNADRLTIYKIGGYTCISNKLSDGSDRYNVGDLVVYIPSDSVLPEVLLKKMDFWDEEKGKGTLAGSLGNRVKPLKLRGVFSEGLLYPVHCTYETICIDGNTWKKINGCSIEDPVDGGDWAWSENIEGMDVSKLLDITKYEPVIPASMGGEIFNGGTEIVVPYDVEPIQKYMTSLKDGEIVEFTEKVHGTQTRFIFTKGLSDDEAFGEDKDIYIASKGQGDKGLFFKANDSNANAYYVKAFTDNHIEEKVKSSNLYKECDMITLFGETYGMQDLKYGLLNGQIGYRLFDVYVGKPRQGRFLNFEECKAFAEEIGVERVPSLYIGPFSFEKVDEYTSGKTTLGTNLNQIREGIVIRPLDERYEDDLGRVLLKSVSEAYKLRKGETTEYN